jgi:hypothetical protein
MLWNKDFWRGAAERAIKSFAQALVVFVGAAGVGVLDIDWVTSLGIAVAVALASVLTSVGNADFTAGPPAAVLEFRPVAPRVNFDPAVAPGPVQPNPTVGDSATQSATDRRAAKLARARGE